MAPYDLSAVTLPDVLTWPYWQAKLDQASDDFEEQVRIAKSMTQEKLFPRIELVQLAGRLQAADNEARGVPGQPLNSGDTAIIYRALAGRKRQMSEWAQVTVARSPLLTSHVLTLPLCRKGPLGIVDMSEKDTPTLRGEFVLAVFQNPMFPFALLSRPDDNVAEEDTSVLMMLQQPYGTSWGATGEWKLNGAIYSLDIYAALGKWRRKRGLPPAVDKARDFVRREGIKDMWKYVQTVASLAGGLPLLDQIQVWGEVEAVWKHEVGSRLGVILPPNPALAALRAALEMGPVES